MATQRADASLDAFDALIAELADAGEIAPSEVAALRAQRQVPQTGEIPVQLPDRRTAAQPVSATEAAVAPPRTRREARALREMQ